MKQGEYRKKGGQRVGWRGFFQITEKPIGEGGGDLKDKANEKGERGILKVNLTECKKGGGGVSFQIDIVMVDLVSKCKREQKTTTIRRKEDKERGLPHPKYPSNRK